MRLHTFKNNQSLFLKACKLSNKLAQVTNAKNVTITIKEKPWYNSITRGSQFEREWSGLLPLI